MLKTVTDILGRQEFVKPSERFDGWLCTDYPVANAIEADGYYHFKVFGKELEKDAILTTDQLWTEYGHELLDEGNYEVIRVDKGLCWVMTNYKRSLIVSTEDEYGYNICAMPRKAKDLSMLKILDFMKLQSRIVDCDIWHNFFCPLGNDTTLTFGKELVARQGSKEIRFETIESCIVWLAINKYI